MLVNPSSIIDWKMKKKLVIFLFFFNILASLGIAQTCDVTNASKLLVLAEYHSFLVDDCYDTSIVTLDTIRVDEIEEVLFLYLRCRNLSYLKFYFQVNFLKTKNISWINFSLTEYEASFKKAFGNIDSIDNISFYERKIGYENFSENKILFQGDFILAYLDGRFIRLKGFRYNDFAEFVFRYLNPGSRFVSPSLSYQLDQVSRKRKREKVLFDLLHIPGLDLPELYNRHVKKKEFREEYSYYLNTVNWLK